MLRRRRADGQVQRGRIPAPGGRAAENTIPLDGVTYSQCPDQQHFLFISSNGTPASESEIAIAPCSEDLENLVAPPTTVQFEIINEFEQHLVGVDDRHLLRGGGRCGRSGQSFTRATLGSETGHLVVRGSRRRCWRDAGRSL